MRRWPRSSASSKDPEREGGRTRRHGHGTRLRASRYSSIIEQSRDARTRAAVPSPSTRPTVVRAATARLDETSVEAVRSLARAARLLEKASGDLGLAHYRVLSAIAAGEDRASRVARRFELGRPTVSAAVDALSRAGLIERAVVAADQRAYELRLTRRGEEVLAAVEAEMVHLLHDVLHRLGDPGEAADALAALGGALDARAEERHALLPKGRPGAGASAGQK